MKAVVVENKNGIAVVLRDDGIFDRMRTQCAVGETVEFKEKAKIVRMPGFKQVAAAAAALAIVCTGTVEYTTTVRACSYVSMDVNPSLEYVLNARDKVVAVNYLNDDAKALAERLDHEKLRGRTVEEAIDVTTRFLEEDGYLGADAASSDDILVTVVTDDPERASRIAGIVEDTIRTNTSYEVNLEICEATKEDRKKAEEYGISSGRYVKTVAQHEETDEDARELTAEEVTRAKNETVEELLKPADKPKTTEDTVEEKQAVATPVVPAQAEKPPVTATAVPAVKTEAVPATEKKQETKKEEPKKAEEAASEAVATAKKEAESEAAAEAEAAAKAAAEEAARQAEAAAQAEAEAAAAAAAEQQAAAEAAAAQQAAAEAAAAEAARQAAEEAARQAAEEAARQAAEEAARQAASEVLQ